MAMKGFFRTLLIVLIFGILEWMMCCAYYLVELYVSANEVATGRVYFTLSQTTSFYAVKFILYAPFLLLLFSGYLYSGTWKKRFWILSLLNCGAYIAVSVLFAVFIEFTREYFYRSFFPVLIVSTLLSPLIAGISPGMRRYLLGK